MSEGGLSPSRFADEMREASERFDVVTGNETTLLIDLDNEYAREQFARVLPKVRKYFGATDVEEWASKSGNRHVKVTLAEPRPIAVRLALQAALGSDGVREVLGLKRMENGIAEPSRLFRPRCEFDFG